MSWAVPALAALLLTHLLEPALPLAWSYAGLALRWGSAVPAVLAAAVVAPLVSLARSRPVARRPFPVLRPRIPIAGTFLLWLLLVLVGLRWPAPDVCPDVLFLPDLLLLLAPSLLVVAVCAWWRGSLLQFAGAVVVVFTGLATIATFGAAFAMGAWIRRLGAVPWRGLNPHGQTLPLGYLPSLRHAGEVLSTFILLDRVGVVLAASLRMHSWLAALLACVLTMPIGIAAGLALATSVVHLMARLDGMHVDFERHIAASPYHIAGVANGFFKPRVAWQAW